MDGPQPGAYRWKLPLPSRQKELTRLKQLVNQLHQKEVVCFPRHSSYQGAREELRLVQMKSRVWKRCLIWRFFELAMAEGFVLNQTNHHIEIIQITLIFCGKKFGEKTDKFTFPTITSLGLRASFSWFLDNHIINNLVPRLFRLSASSHRGKSLGTRLHHQVIATL